jgi:hypothetical protein
MDHTRVDFVLRFVSKLARGTVQKTSFETSFRVGNHTCWKQDHLCGRPLPMSVLLLAIFVPRDGLIDFRWCWCWVFPLVSGYERSLPR